MPPFNGNLGSAPVSRSTEYELLLQASWRCNSVWRRSSMTVVKQLRGASLACAAVTASRRPWTCSMLSSIAAWIVFNTPYRKQGKHEWSRSRQELVRWCDGSANYLSSLSTCNHTINWEFQQREIGIGAKWGGLLRRKSCISPQLDGNRSMHLCSLLRSRRPVSTDDVARGEHSSLFHNAGNLCLVFWWEWFPPKHTLHKAEIWSPCLQHSSREEWI